MAVGMVLVGIMAGLFTAGTVLVLGGGIGLAALAYVCGGMAGLLGGMVSTALPRRRVAVLVSQDQG